VTFDAHPPRPDGLYAQVQRLADAQLETNERIGHLMREVVELKMGQQRMGLQLADLVGVQHEYRRRLESVPEIVEDTGRHQIVELERKMAQEKAANLATRLTRADDRRWQVILVLITAVSGIVCGFLARHLLGGHGP
jgi:hypothetical protein